MFDGVVKPGPMLDIDHDTRVGHVGPDVLLVQILCALLNPDGRTTSRTDDVGLAYNAVAEAGPPDGKFGPRTAKVFDVVGRMFGARGVGTTVHRIRFVHAGLLFFLNALHANDRVWPHLQLHPDADRMLTQAGAHGPALRRFFEGLATNVECSPPRPGPPPRRAPKDHLAPERSRERQVASLRGLSRAALRSIRPT